MLFAYPFFIIEQPAIEKVVVARNADTRIKRFISNLLIGIVNILLGIIMACSPTPCVENHWIVCVVDFIKQLLISAIVHQFE